MTSFALMTSAELNARLGSLLEVMREWNEFHPVCVADLADEAACLHKVLNRRSCDLDMVLADLEATFHEAATTEQ
jgi:hypothetical protein